MSYMKKLFVLAVLLLGISVSVVAQEKKTVAPEKKSLFTITAGPAFPVGAFAAKDPATNLEAGFAKVGYNISAQFRYRFRSGFGLGTSFNYVRHSLDISKADVTGLIVVDHWQYYSFMIGPCISTRINDKLRFDLKSYIGIASANSPRFIVQGTTVFDEQWENAVALQIGGNLRYNFSENWCFITSLDYNYMKPSFKAPDESGNMVSAPQKISSLALTAGVGYRF